MTVGLQSFKGVYQPWFELLWFFASSQHDFFISISNINVCDFSATIKYNTEQPKIWIIYKSDFFFLKKVIHFFAIVNQGVGTDQKIKKDQKRSQKITWDHKFPPLDRKFLLQKSNLIYIFCVRNLRTHPNYYPNMSIVVVLTWILWG